MPFLGHGQIGLRTSLVSAAGADGTFLGMFLSLFFLGSPRQTLALDTTSRFAVSFLFHLGGPFLFRDPLLTPPLFRQTQGCEGVSPPLSVRTSRSADLFFFWAHASGSFLSHADNSDSLHPELRFPHPADDSHPNRPPSVVPLGLKPLPYSVLAFFLRPHASRAW